MSYFLDFSGLLPKDIEEINQIGKAFNLDYKHAVGKYMNDYPGKIRVLAEIKNGEIIRDEIDENGVKEYKNEEAVRRMIADVVKRRKDRENDK